MDRFRYDDSDIHLSYARSRKLPDRALRLWMEAVARHVPGEVARIADVGCGTGRFAAGLTEQFDAKVIGIDLSEKMLSVACCEVRNESVRLTRAGAERLPIRDAALDLVFVSMVWHHIAGKGEAAREFGRVLAPGGRVVIRTATRELLPSYLWSRFFPKAAEIDAERTPSRAEIVGALEQAGLRLAAHEVVAHPFADSLTDYAEKIAMRGLSPLKQTSNEEFGAGMAALREYCREHETGEPVTEDIELFVFKPAT